MEIDNNEDTIRPYITESPSMYADRLGIHYASSVSDQHKKDLGQFFTPSQIAKFMSEFVTPTKEKIKILDPGCGVGILSCAVGEYIANTYPLITDIELVAFETDIALLPLAEQSLDFLRTWLAQQGINLTFFLCKNDFILHNSKVLNNSLDSKETYDVIIANPPYFKLGLKDERIIVAKSVIFGQTNIYSIFLIIAARLLTENGQLIFITPRSFCSGSYFRLFRQIFFSLIDLKVIHLFNSRKEAFKRDKILQENIIIVAVKQSPTQEISKNIFKSIEKQVTISTSQGLDDLDRRITKIFCLKDLIAIDSYQKILHLPSNSTDEKVISIFRTWDGSLNKYGIEISTGPVVDFRSKEFIRFRNGKNKVPLIWLHNIGAMKIIWPIYNGYKGKPKGQFIINTADSKSRLIPNKNYVFLRRFSSKDDNKRLIAAPYINNKSEKIENLGIENHLNYIYKKKGELSKVESEGLAALLNSTLFDLYFRTFNGNINVSATELREFPLPDLKLIRTMGTRINELYQVDLTQIDAIVLEIFRLPINLFDLYHGQNRRSTTNS